MHYRFTTMLSSAAVGSAGLAAAPALQALSHYRAVALEGR